MHDSDAERRIEVVDLGCNLNSTSPKPIASRNLDDVDALGLFLVY